MQPQRVMTHKLRVTALQLTLSMALMGLLVLHHVWAPKQHES